MSLWKQFVEIFTVSVTLYYVVNIILWTICDCNIKLWWKTKFGAPISSLRGQVVWITGASSGIGKALAINLSRHGVKLALSARRTDLLNLVKEQCLSESNGLLGCNDILVLPMDILKFEHHNQCLSKVLNHFGCLDVLVNNAGRSQRATWENIHVQVDRDIFELDVFSVIHLSRLVVHYFLENKRGVGHIAVTSSLAGLFAVPFSASYCGAKHAINAYMLALRTEQPSIHVSVFNPGPVRTDFLKEAFTNNPQETVGVNSDHSKRLSVERCGYLYAVALANKLELSWCGVFPINLLTYMNRYALIYPFIPRLLNKNALKKLRDGR